ncbi:TonB-dependent SusC/RagA subfamily outer membrane receptor [Pedobacter sp. CAN_A7]|uniref:carboxypeptidase-like regulatory domain-containing protein n=1 Tax=Pedobacter sp. CAN_A7 TaxID=2787722 RepID=UPI001A2B8AD4
MKDLQLIMTNPCSENWDDMQQIGAGKYCDRCEKNIVDLTDKSDAELIKFFNKKEDNVCGRLLSTQLDRKLVQPPSKINWQWLMSLAIGASVVSPALAQKPSQDTIQGDKSSALRSLSFESAVKSSILRDRISGKVIDEGTGKALAGVKVRQKGFQNVIAITDRAGMFQLDLSIEDSAIPLILSSPGYAEKETTFEENMGIKMAVAGPNTIRIGGVSRVNLDKDKEPLIVITSGDKSCTIDTVKFKEISHDWIEAIEVLKDAKTTAIYGAQGANGVIILKVKEAYANKFDFSKKK